MWIIFFSPSFTEKPEKHHYKDILFFFMKGLLLPAQFQCEKGS